MVLVVFDQVNHRQCLLGIYLLENVKLGIQKEKRGGGGRCKINQWKLESENFTNSQLVKQNELEKEMARKVGKVNAE